jgi:hypothetical protein
MSHDLTEMFCSTFSITKAELAIHCEPLLTNLFLALTKEGSQENEYVMKGISDILFLLKVEHEV